MPFYGQEIGKLKFHKIFNDGITIEPKALNQFYDALKLKCTVQGALMPDAHQGYSLPIGGVVATRGVIFPSWVGYDIGCGMCAIPLDVDRHIIDDNQEAIFDQIYRAIPMGSINHEYPQNGFLFYGRPYSSVIDCYRKDKDPLKQLGTLGSGNHFIEIGYDETDRVWIIAHSGSRNFGWKVAQHYMKQASPTGKASEGHFGFDVNSEEGMAYINDMNLCLDFALSNRRNILYAVIDSMRRVVGEFKADWDEFINRNHNHAVERDGLWIHRKGATHAEDGMMGVIPGNMRDGSFIVRGKGNPNSLWSSSHGAGRVLGRKQAKETLDFEKFKDTMCGIKARVNQDTLDESPFAYKSIFEVMNAQKDLVEIVHHVRPIINVKGL